MEGSLSNRLMENMVNRPAPEVGGGATISMYSDRHPCTIIHVDGDLIVVQRDAVTGDTSKGELQMGHQNWIITPSAEGQIQIFHRLKDGALVPYGCKSAKKSGQRLLIGQRDAYHDWEF